MNDDKMLAVGIDPDTKATGVAVVQAFNGGLQIVHVGLVRAKGRKTSDRRVEMARNLQRDLCRLYLNISYTPTAVAIEWMKLRPKGEKNPNSIVDLNGISGMCVVACQQLGAEHVFTPIPSEWKGTVPKSVHQKRVLRRLRLTSDLTYEESGNPIPGSEKIPASMRTHVIDALGLACWALDPHGPVWDARVAARAKARSR